MEEEEEKKKKRPKMELCPFAYNQMPKLGS